MRRLAVLLLAVAWGCSSVDVGGLAESFGAGDIEGVREQLRDLAQQDEADAHLWLMNRAVVDLASGDPPAGIGALRRARDRLDELRSRSYPGWIEAMLSDDRALVYEGADYEHVLVRAYLALLDLACRQGDVIAYLNQMLQRQVDLREGFVTDDGQKPKLAEKSAAIGNWLLAAVEADDPTRRDVVARQLATVLEHEPACRLARVEAERFRREGLCRPGHGVVQVVAMVGLGPYRVARDEPVSSLVLDIAHRVYNARRDRVAIPLNAVSQVQIAGLVLRSDNPEAAWVEVGAVRQTTEVITSVDRLAQAEFDAMRTQMVVRAVVRRIFKLASAELGKSLTERKASPQQTPPAATQGDKRVVRKPETAAEKKKREEEERRQRKKEQQNQVNSFLWDALAWIWVALEDADTRCWALLPASFQAARLELPEGEHEVSVRAAVGGAAVGAEQRVRVRVRAGHTTFVVAQVPSRQGGPPPVTSDPAGVGVRSSDDP
ncbi:MAG: hypothetical protein R3F56_02510 [Planctomycetota bacterium]